MPEGPSIVILKELVQDLHLNKTEILGIAGNTKTIDKDRLQHQYVQDFKSWGKHFLICFDDFTIRIHFMLFGSYLINERKKMPLRLGLIFKHAELNFYACSVKLLEGNADDLYDWSADVMADEWDSKAAARKLKDNPNAWICDVLLDQHIFAGVGNIIKNEVLYRIGVHPLSKIRDLPPAKTKSLIKEARQYSFDFLKWKKAYTLRKHWKIYSKKFCPFGHHVEKDILGKTRRQTYYCLKCQNQYK